MNMKKILVGTATGALMLGFMVTTVFADQPTSPGTYGTAADNAQCGTSAMSGAFNAHNLVYGPNSSVFGQSGGASGGQTGISNSAVCGNRQDNL